MYRKIQFFNSKDAEKFRQDLLAIARTTLSSKVLAADKDYFAELAVSAVLRLKVPSSFFLLENDGFADE
jgi:chaperonin GroEL (HSP60 family)